MSVKTSDILHESGDFWVSNEGTRGKPAFHVWRVGITHSKVDSAYDDFSLAVARCDYLGRYYA